MCARCEDVFCFLPLSHHLHNTDLPVTPPHTHTHQPAHHHAQPSSSSPPQHKNPNPQTHTKNTTRRAREELFPIPPAAAPWPHPAVSLIFFPSRARAGAKPVGPLFRRTHTDYSVQARVERPQSGQVVSAETKPPLSFQINVVGRRLDNKHCRRRAGDGNKRAACCTNDGYKPRHSLTLSYQS